jgi:2-hydroxychromene-2-carboxylate isomerase
MMTNFLGMTVNERLSEAGIEGAWDQAVKDEDREKLAQLANLVGLQEQAPAIIDAEIERWRYNKPKEIRYQEIMKRQNEARPK